MTMPITYANQDFDMAQSAAFARCKRLGHEHHGYCDDSWRMATMTVNEAQRSVLLACLKAEESDDEPASVGQTGVDEMAAEQMSAAGIVEIDWMSALVWLTDDGREVAKRL